jgi:hypothetical protein
MRLPTLTDDLLLSAGGISVQLRPRDAFALAERLLDRAARRVVIEAAAAEPRRTPRAQPRSGRSRNDAGGRRSRAAGRGPAR